MDENLIHKIIAELTKDLTENAGELPSKSFIFLDSKTINLLLLYILMNKDLQLLRLTNRNLPVNIQKALVEEIDRMMNENKQSFEEILKGLRNNP
jgi:hypothetical protein